MKSILYKIKNFIDLGKVASSDRHLIYKVIKKNFFVVLYSVFYKKFITKKMSSSSSSTVSSSSSSSNSQKRKFCGKVYEPLNPLKFEDFKQKNLVELLNDIMNNYHLDWRRLHFTQKYYCMLKQCFIRRMCRLG